MRQKEIDSEPNFQSTAKRRLYGYDCKRPEPDGIPVKKFLNSKVGKNYADIFGEVVRRHKEFDYDPRYSILEVLDWHIEKVIGYNDNGEPLNSRGMELSGGDLYVNEHNILCRYVRPKRQKQVDKKPWYAIINGVHYAEKNGLWYKLTLEKLPPEKWVSELYTYHIDSKNKEHKMWRTRNVSESRFDVFFGHDIKRGDSACKNRWWNGEYYCTKYSSCNTKDMKLIKQYFKKLSEA